MTQALVSFSGLNAGNVEHWGCNFVFSRGVTPSVCLLRTIPEPTITSAIGTLVLQQDQTVAFSGCIAGPPVLKPLRHNGQHFAWSIPVYDRRWKWQFAHIYGDYNRRTSCGSIIEHTRKSAQELAELLMFAMGEWTYDVSAVPSNVYPPADWTNHPKAALELQRLCDKLGMVPGIDYHDDRAKVWPLGVGGNLPANADIINPNYTGNVSRRPALVSLVAGYTLFGMKVKLKPVGDECDGTIVDLDQLSYKPARGWGLPDYFSNVGRTFRRLAFRSVYRKFAVDTVTIPALPFPIDANSLTPWLPKDTCRPWSLEGNFWPSSEIECNVSCEAYSGEWDIDSERGLVISEKPIYKIGSDGLPTDPDLYLFMFNRVRLPEGNWVRYTNEMHTDGSGGKVVLRHPELHAIHEGVYHDCATVPASINVITPEEEATQYVLENVRRWQNVTTQDLSYLGLTFPRLDGAIAQITWRIGDKQAARTRASRGFEHAVTLEDSWDQRRHRWMSEYVFDKEWSA